MTLIEFIMVMGIIAALSATGAFLLLYFVQSSTAIPQQLNIDGLLADVMDVMIEGDSQAKGLRFSKGITRVRAQRIDFINQDDQAIIYRWRLNQNRLTRSIDGGAQEVFPYYLPSSGVTFSASGNRLFRYYDANEAVTNTPADVRRIALNLSVSFDVGSLVDWDVQATQMSSIAVVPFP